MFDSVKTQDYKSSQGERRRHTRRTHESVESRRTVIQSDLSKVKDFHLRDQVQRKKVQVICSKWKKTSSQKILWRPYQQGRGCADFPRAVQGIGPYSSRSSVVAGPYTAQQEGAAVQCTDRLRQQSIQLYKCSRHIGCRAVQGLYNSPVTATEGFSSGQIARFVVLYFSQWADFFPGWESPCKL
jgi:hypothetical protein